MKILVVGLVMVALALTVERIYLRRQRKHLKQIEQTFTFHRLRDDLQDLAVSGELDTQSRLYDFLTALLNIGIKNASTFRASELLMLGQNRKSDIPALESDFVSHVRLYSHDVQHFVGVCFYEFSKMLLMNDPVFAVRRGVLSILQFAYKKAMDSTHELEPHPLLRTIFPQSADTFEKAAKYKAISDDLQAYA